MRDIVRFRTGPDGTVILAPTPEGDLDAGDIDVSLAGRTIEIRTPTGDTPVALEVVHGETA